MVRLSIEKMRNIFTPAETKSSGELFGELAAFSAQHHLSRNNTIRQHFANGSPGSRLPPLSRQRSCDREAPGGFRSQ